MFAARTGASPNGVRRDGHEPAAQPGTAIVLASRAAGGITGALRRWTGRLVGPQQEERLERLQTRANEFGVDPFGLDIEFAKAAIAPVVWLYKNYFRVEVTGAVNVPQGRTLLVSNHSGQLPFDGAMIGVASLLEAEPPRMIRAMVEKWVPSIPYFAPLFARLGQVVGTPENCRRLLAQGETILVFPEGVRGISKLYRDRYKLQEFGNGFLRLALETRSPVVPVAVVGAEEQAPALADLKSVARVLGMPALPVTITGLPLPLPVKYRIRFGEPLLFEGNADEEDAEIEKKVHQVKATIQAMLNQGLRERRHVFW